MSTINKLRNEYKQMSNLIQPQKTKLHCAWHSSVPLVSLSIVRHASTQLRKPAPIGTASLHGHLRGVSINLPSIIFNINQTFHQGSIRVLEGSWMVPGRVPDPSITSFNTLTFSTYHVRT